MIIQITNKESIKLFEKFLLSSSNILIKQTKFYSKPSSYYCSTISTSSSLPLVSSFRADLFLINKQQFIKANSFVRSIYSSIKHTQKQKDVEQKQSIIESSINENNSQVSTHVTGARRAKQAVKDVSYGFIILGGGVLLLGIFYFLFSELFSRETPSGIYDESSKICLNDYKVQDALGTPIKVTAESGGRRVFQIKRIVGLDKDRTKTNEETAKKVGVSETIKNYALKKDVKDSHRSGRPFKTSLRDYHTFLRSLE